MKRALLLFLCLAVLTAGCGSKKSSTPKPVGPVLPAAQTADEWALRVVNIFLRPLNKDLNVVTNFNNPQIQLFIASQNPTTLRIIKNRMNDLNRCSAKLIQIGPPPKGHPQLDTIDNDFHKACVEYEKVADVLQRATPLLASGRTDVMAEGAKMVRGVKDASGRAADNFANGLRIAQGLPEFRRAGLKPSV
ncbi:MAG: hypothetical protein E6G64_04605 [Actinobacteria bacterium]|nr:MAG: hypothetical protein E6G64_04605 [Actinomycetota bacterium]